MPNGRSIDGSGSFSNKADMLTVDELAKLKIVALVSHKRKKKSFCREEIEV